VSSRGVEHVLIAGFIINLFGNSSLLRYSVLYNSEVLVFIQLVEVRLGLKFLENLFV